MSDKNKIHIKGCDFIYRIGSSDLKALKEVVVKQSYRHRFKESRRSFDILPNENWLDLGANIGAFTVWAGNKGAKVKAFEPEKENYELLCENINVNRLRGCQAHKQAVIGIGEKERKIFLANSGREWRHSLVGNSENTQFVDCAYIDDILTSDIDGIKMDIEGAEFEIFDNIKSWKNVSKLVFEYDFDIEPSMDKFWFYIKKLGSHFKHIEIENSIKKASGNWNFYPPGRLIYCFRS